jgi:gliding motility-associated-like protein
MGAVTLGGNSPGAATFLWTVNDPQITIATPTAAMIDVSAPGTYTLTVANAEGCTATDQAVVMSNFDVPVGNVSISEVTCFNDNDGAIIIEGVQGGVPPYTYQLNGGLPTNNPFFGNLGGAAYTLLITDANGCFTELSIMLLEPTEVAVNLTTSLPDNGTTLELGQSVTLTANYDPSIQVDTIIWRPDSIAMGDNRNSVTISPNETTTYTVTVRDINGCSDSDKVTIIVRKERNVYLPTAFSPDEDGTNDVLFPQAGADVARINSFMVFNRWGESVFENRDFAPNDPTQGWDGRHRGQRLNAAVFVYYLEVEFTDGEVLLLKGDVMLMK